MPTLASWKFGTGRCQDLRQLNKEEGSLIIPMLSGSDGLDSGHGFSADLLIALLGSRRKIVHVKMLQTVLKESAVRFNRIIT
jgi:hypothetical protein